MKLQSYEKTPIYRKTRELLRDAYAITGRMGRGYKYSLGVRLTDYAQLLTESVFLAYEEQGDLHVKLKHIEAMQRATQRILINYRIASDLNQISRSDYAAQVSRIIDVIKQTRGWKTSTINAIAGV